MRILHPFNLGCSLSGLAERADDALAALCAFGLALHDPLGLVGGK
jgi:hypothetical protein